MYSERCAEHRGRARLISRPSVSGCYCGPSCIGTTLWARIQSAQEGAKPCVRPLVLWITGLLLPISFSAAGRTKSPASETRSQSIASGKTLFMQHCASCHGDDAKGAGPAAVALKKQPPDLTALAKRNHGKFPYDQVSKAITGDFAVPAHGSREMPMWGPLFLALTGENAREAERLTTNLTDYIKSIQVK